MAIGYWLARILREAMYVRLAHLRVGSINAVARKDGEGWHSLLARTKSWVSEMFWLAYLRVDDIYTAARTLLWVILGKRLAARVWASQHTGARSRQMWVTCFEVAHTSLQHLGGHLGGGSQVLSG